MVCVDTADDPDNCGGCGQQCGIGLTCSTGSCVCGGEATLCGTQCVDLQSDSANCGYCGHNCEGNPCAGSLCSPSIVAETQGGYWVGDIAVSSTDIFWTSPNTVNTATELGGVMGQSIASIAGTGVTLAIAPIGTEDSPQGIAVDVNNLYWVDSATPGSVVEYDLLSGQRFTWPAGDAGASGIESPVDVAVDSNNIYWVDIQAGTVNQTSISPGGPIYVLALNRVSPRAIATDGTNVYWVDVGTESGANADGTVNQVPVDGGSVVPLATGEAEPWDIATDGAYVYWTDCTNPGSVKRVPVGGGVTPTVLASNQGAPYGIAVDPAAQYVYWTTYDGNTVMRMPVAGTGLPYTLAQDQDNPTAIVVDEVNVYWAAGSSIVKLAR
jgi:sugar lactone lactonase YvrE